MSDIESVPEQIPFEEEYRRELLLIGELAAGPSFEEDIAAIVEKQLSSGPVTVDTGTQLLRRLVEYFGPADESVARLLFILLALAPESEDIERMLDVVKDDPDRSALVSIVRRLRALYFEPLGRALAINGQLADDWQSVNAEGLYVVSKDTWEMEVRVTKYSGELLLLRCPPSALVGLIAFMLNSINRIPSSAGGQLIMPERMDELAIEFEELQERFDQRNQALSASTMVNGVAVAPAPVPAR